MPAAMRARSTSRPDAAGLLTRLLASMLGPRRRARRRVAADDEAASIGDPGGDAECRRAMRSVIDGQIIPRLLQANRRPAANAAHGAPLPVSRADIEHVARLCVSGDRQAVVQLVGRLLAKGVELEHVMVELIGPAARHLGELWEDDRMSFSEVTLGLVQMHELIHRLGYEFRDGPQQAGAVRRVMLASAPGSQHVLGLSIVSEVFRRDGWQVVLEVSPTRRELCHAVKNEWFDVVGLSVGLDAQLPGLPALVAQLKAASRNPATPVMLGGPVFTLHALQPQPLGAQAICLDARDSVGIALSLLPD